MPTFVVPTLVQMSDGADAPDAEVQFSYHFVATGAQQVVSSYVWGAVPSFPSGTYRVVDGRLCKVLPGVPPDFATTPA